MRTILTALLLLAALPAAAQDTSHYRDLYARGLAEAIASTPYIPVPPAPHHPIDVVPPTAPAPSSGASALPDLFAIQGIQALERIGARRRW